MSILTIAREHGVWTTEAGEVLARRLNAVLLTKEELERRLIDAGMTQKTFQRYDEKKPGFFSSLSSDMDLYILYLKTIMLEVAQESNVIISRTASGYDWSHQSNSESKRSRRNTDTIQTPHPESSGDATQTAPDSASSTSTNSGRTRQSTT